MDNKKWFVNIGIVTLWITAITWIINNVKLKRELKSVKACNELLKEQLDTYDELNEELKEKIKKC